MSDTGKIVRIGQMRKRITLQSYVDVPVNSNQTENQYTDIATVWARIEPNTGVESRFNKTKGQSFTHYIYIKYRSDVDSDTFIDYDGYKYRVRSVEDAGDAKKRYLILECEKAFKPTEINNPNKNYSDPDANEFKD